jgi:Kef-type K+ transport system membrane component KefB
MDHDLAGRVAPFVLQVAVVLIAAKLAAEVAARAHLPTVVGELAAGIALGPHAIGGLVVAGFGPLFPPSTAPVPISSELYAVSQTAAVLLLFTAGLETDFRLFLRSLAPAMLVGLGGVLLPFFGGAAATVASGVAPALTHPTALFVGAALTATSVGITARVLTEIEATHTREAVTVLAAAVVDDVLAIMALTLALGTSPAGSLSAGQMAVAGVKAFGVWAGLTAVFVGGGRWIELALVRFRAPGARIALGLGLAVLAAVVAEAFGLAMIIGAYSAGLGLSRRPLGRRLRNELESIEQFLVPVFFVAIGLMVDPGAIPPILGFGSMITGLAVLTKLIGAGAPALLLGYGRLGAARVAVGMLPRGEVALVIAGLGLAAGAIDRAMFGVAVLMTLVTTLVAPPVLVALFRPRGPGRRRS